MFTIRRYSTAACVLAILGTTLARAFGPEDSALRGPRIADGQTQRTLVARGFDGEILALDAPPAISALDLIGLDEPTEQKIHELLTERSRIMDDIILSNIELLSQIETVMAVGRPAEKLTMFQEGLAALEPARAWGKLQSRISAVLPGPSRAGYLGLIGEYEEARYTQAIALGRAEHRFEHRMARYWEDMTWEIERAAERVFEDDEDDKWLERLTERLGLSPMQEGEIRAMAERFYIDAKGRPTEAQEMAFIGKIRTVMTIEQRWKFTAMMLKGELDPDNEDE